jgi:hypothetical protein
MAYKSILFKEHFGDLLRIFSFSLNHEEKIENEEKRSDSTEKEKDRI